MSALRTAALKMIKSFISPDQLREITADLLKRAIEEKDKINLDVLNNEADACAIFYEVGGKAYFSIAILSPENNILRFENTQEVSFLIETMIKNL